MKCIGPKAKDGDLWIAVLGRIKQFALKGNVDRG